MTLCAYIDGPWDGDWNEVSDELVGQNVTAFSGTNKVVYRADRYRWLPVIGKVLFMDDDDRDFAQYLDSAEQGWMYVYGDPATEVKRAKLKRMLESRQP